MLQVMTGFAKPDYIEFVFISSIVMSMWLALLGAFRAMIGANQFSSTDSVVNGISGLKFLRVVFPEIPFVLALPFWIESTPLFFPLLYKGSVFTTIKKILFVDFLRIRSGPFSFVGRHFFGITALPFSYAL